MDKHGAGNISVSYCSSYTFNRYLHISNEIFSTGFIKDRKLFPFKCNTCERSFKRKRSLVQHVNHECGVTFKCQECKQNFKTKGYLRTHLHNVHMIARRELDKFGAGMILYADALP